TRETLRSLPTSARPAPGARPRRDTRSRLRRSTPRPATPRETVAPAAPLVWRARRRWRVRPLDSPTRGQVTDARVHVSMTAAASRLSSRAMRKQRIGIVFGGRSTEHEVSVASATAIHAALDPVRYAPVLIGVAHDGAWHVVEAGAGLTPGEVVGHPKARTAF